MEIEYTYGNGYSCACCRTETNGTLEVESKEGAIAECIKLNTAFKGDFDITRIRIDDEDELIDTINEAMSKQVIEDDLNKKIEDTNKEIKEIQTWFDTLESIKEGKKIYLKNLLKDLQEFLKEKSNLKNHIKR